MRKSAMFAALACCSIGAAAFGQCDDSITSTFSGGNGHRGAMWDLTCLNPDGITITSFDFNARAGTSGQAIVEVYYVTDHTSYVGKENNGSLWTLLGTETIPSINPNGTPTPVNIGGLTIAFGETCGLYFTRSDGISIEYTNGPLGAFQNNDVRWEDRGIGGEYPFLLSFNNRIFNGTVYYDCGGGGGYRLTVGGTCPGTVTVDWAGATPNVQQGIAFGQGQGSTIIPGGPCAGTMLGIQGGVQLVRTVSTGSGSGGVAGNAGTGACGGYLQLVEAGSCNTSNVDQIP
ncbi:MAG: hypothetical protein IT430_07720 [Phycisphaerales bacterium]|nr:hypothetical protein [Phycisphaerales bacterium]